MTGIKATRGLRGHLEPEDVEEVIQNHIAAALRIEPRAVKVEMMNSVDWRVDEGTIDTGDKAWPEVDDVE